MSRRTRTYWSLATLFTLVLTAYFHYPQAFSCDSYAVSCNKTSVEEEVPASFNFNHLPLSQQPVSVKPFEQMAIPLNLPFIKDQIGYPKMAIDAGISGKVVFRILVNERGQYVRHFVFESDNPVLRLACEEKLPLMRFIPAKRYGMPTKCWINVPFHFILEP
ncbi:MAG: energy transducer TonB [Bacteroidota bacterium]